MFHWLQNFRALRFSLLYACRMPNRFTRKSGKRKASRTKDIFSFLRQQSCPENSQRSPSPAWTVLHGQVARETREGSRMEVGEGAGAVVGIMSDNACNWNREMEASFQCPAVRALHVRDRAKTWFSTTLEAPCREGSLSFSFISLAWCLEHR